MNIRETIIEVLYAIMPITIVIFILQLTLVRFPMEVFVSFLVGVIITILGFTLFLIGVRTSLLSIGEMVGVSLMKSGKLWFAIGFGISIGFAVTVAEPGVQVLANQIESVSYGEISKHLLVAVVSLGVGIFLALSLLRVVFKIPLTLLMMGGYALVFILALFSSPEFFAVSFDAGGATTGPVTVPFILALGVGMSSVRGAKTSSDDSFGFVGLASIGPILAVLVLGVIF